MKWERLILRMGSTSYAHLKPTGNTEIHDEEVWLSHPRDRLPCSYLNYLTPSKRGKKSRRMTWAVDSMAHTQSFTEKQLLHHIKNWQIYNSKFRPSA